MNTQTKNITVIAAGFVGLILIGMLPMSPAYAYLGHHAHHPYSRRSHIRYSSSTVGASGSAPSGAFSPSAHYPGVLYAEGYYEYTHRVHIGSPSGRINLNHISFALGSSWFGALSNIEAQVRYQVSVTKNGVPIQPGASVAVGDKLTLSFTPHRDADISWFAGSYSSPVESSYSSSDRDSPYGEWSSNASLAASCNVGYAWTYGGNYAVYIPFAVNPPKETIQVPAGLTCGALSKTANGGSMTCTVTSAASGQTISPIFNFGSTYGEFYYQLSHVGTCNSAGVPMSTVANGSAYKLPIPSRSISYPIKVTSASTPTVPMLSCPATVAAGQAATFSVTATDPNQTQVRYGLDWTGSSAAPTEWAPATGYVDSGTTQKVTHTWTNPGTYSVRALTQNANGGTSAWSAPCSVTVKAPPSATLTATPSVPYGSRATLTWSASSDATSCTTSGNWSTGGKLNGSGLTSPLTQDTTFTFQCTGPGGTSALQSAVVKVMKSTVSQASAASCSLTPTGTIQATPDRVPSSGAKTQLSWTISGYDSAAAFKKAPCKIVGNDGTSITLTGTPSSCTVSGTTSVRVMGQVTYGLQCGGNTLTSNGTAPTQTTVNTASSFGEF